MRFYYSHSNLFGAKPRGFSNGAARQNKVENTALEAYVTFLFVCGCECACARVRVCVNKEIPTERRIKSIFLCNVTKQQFCDSIACPFFVCFDQTNTKCNKVKNCDALFSRKFCVTAFDL